MESSGFANNFSIAKTFYKWSLLIKLLCEIFWFCNVIIFNFRSKISKGHKRFQLKFVEQIFVNIIFLWNVWLMLKQTNPHRFIHIQIFYIINRILFKWIHVIICITVSPELKHDDTIWNLKLSIYCTRVVDSLWIVHNFILSTKRCRIMPYMYM